MSDNQTIRPITIGRDSKGYFYVQQGALVCDALCVGEMLEQVMGLLIADGLTFRPGGYGMKTKDEVAAYREKWGWRPLDYLY